MKKNTITKVEFKSRVAKLGIDAVEATVLFGFENRQRLYAESEGVSKARLILLETFEKEKANGQLGHRIADYNVAIAEMRADIEASYQAKKSRQKKVKK
jgi:hypothetical protein